MARWGCPRASARPVSARERKQPQDNLAPVETRGQRLGPRRGLAFCRPPQIRNADRVVTADGGLGVKRLLGSRPRGHLNA